MQLEIPYPEGPGYAKKRETSRAAAVTLTRHSHNELLVIHALADHAMTDYELCDYLQCEMKICQPRRSELTARGRIKDSGERRLTPYNKKAIVWMLASHI